MPRLLRWAVGFLLTAAPAAADYVVFHDGRYMHVRKWEFIDQQLKVELDGGASMSFASVRVRYVAPDIDVNPQPPPAATSVEIAPLIAAPAEPWLRYSDERFVPSIRRICEEQSVDPALVAAVVRVESDFRPGAVSPKGAQGLMQLMPATARELQVADPLDPDANLNGGVRYLRSLLVRYDGRLDLALAAYNAGPRAVDQASGVPPYAETRQYVKKVLALLDGDGL